jgi:hypothetical protein
MVDYLLIIQIYRFLFHIMLEMNIMVVKLRQTFQNLPVNNNKFNFLIVKQIGCLIKNSS